MKEVKFKAWDKKRNCWLWGNGALDKPYDSGNKFGGWELNTKPDVILLPYTGLKDKNNREIYEGDIVKYKNIFSVVMFYNAHFIISDQPSTGHEDLWKAVEKGTVEVVGNFFENPELKEKLKR